MLRSLDARGVRAPLDGGARIVVPETEKFPKNGPDRKDGWTRSLSQLRSVEGGIWAKIFGQGVGNFEFLRKRSNEETLTVKHVFVRYFLPSEAYMKESLELAGVTGFVNTTKRKKPVFMITGLMWTVGASLSHMTQKQTGVKGEAGVTEPHTQATIGAGGGVHREDALLASFDGSKPFILGMRVRKIWWDGTGTRQIDDDVVGSTLQSGQSKTEGGVGDGLQSQDDFTVDLADGANASDKVTIDESKLLSDDPIVWVLP